MSPCSSLSWLLRWHSSDAHSTVSSPPVTITPHKPSTSAYYSSRTPHTPSSSISILVSETVWFSPLKRFLFLQILPCVASSPSLLKPWMPSELVSQPGVGWCRLLWAGNMRLCNDATFNTFNPFSPSLSFSTCGRRPPSRKRTHRHRLLLVGNRAGRAADYPHPCFFPPLIFPSSLTCAGVTWQSVRAEPWVVCMCVFLTMQLLWEVRAHNTLYDNT